MAAMRPSESVVIVGAGMAGLQLAVSLREKAYAGRVILVGDEPVPPYNRPPLSKAYLMGSVQDQELWLRPAKYFQSQQILLLSGQRVSALLRDERRVVLGDDGSSLQYTHLVLAVGARNRKLSIPGSELDGVAYLRTLEESRALKARLRTVERVIVVGAGFIGLEFARVAAKLGMEVTVIEALERPMARALTSSMSALFTREHSRHGVRFLFNTQLQEILGDTGRVAAVKTSGGDEIPAELVVIGIGVVPNTELAEAAGLATDDGIIVDQYLRSTSDPHVSAIGDCAAHPNPHGLGAVIRLESVQNATDQARCCAARIIGQPECYQSVPWFWSEQGNLKLQTVGLAAGYDVSVVRGDQRDTSCSIFCFRRGRLVAVEAVNRPADYMVGRKLLVQRGAITPEQAADESVDLRELCAPVRGADPPDRSARR